MRTKAVLTIAAALSLTLSACGSGGASGGSTTLRIGDGNPPGHPHILMDERFADEVEKRTNGRVKIEVIGGAQLGSEPELVEALHNGTLDFASVLTSAANSYVPETNLLGAFYLFESWDSFLTAARDEAVQNEVRRVVKEANAGFQFLNWGTTGTFNIYGTKPFPNSDSLKGAKMRIPDVKIQADSWRALGMNTVTVPYSEEYTAMQSGIADASQHSLGAILTNKFYEVGKHITMSRTYYDTAALYVSDVVRGKVSDEDYQVIQKVADEVGEWSLSQGPEYDSNNLAKLKKQDGVKIVEPTDTSKWVEKLKPINDAYAKEIGAGKLYELMTGN